MNNVGNKFIGKWTIDPHDHKSINEYGKITMIFLEDGNLTYTIHLKEKDQIIYLKYWVDKGELVTDQPSAPGIRKTPFKFTSDGVLKLFENGFETTYTKISNLN